VKFGAEFEIILQKQFLSVVANHSKSDFSTGFSTGLRAITAPGYQQPNKLSQLQKTQLNLLTVTFLAV